METRAAMSLLSLDVPHYIKRTRVFVDFKSDSLQPGERYVPQRETARYQYELPTGIQNVIGLELRSYAVRNEVAGTFVGKYFSVYPGSDLARGLPVKRSTVPGNMILDVELTDADNTTTITFPVDMEGVLSLTSSGTSLSGITIDPIDLLYTFLVFNIPFALLQAADPVINTSTYRTIFPFNAPFPEGTSRFLFAIREIAPPYRFGRVRFLFRSGPNEADSIHRVLGFDKADTTPDPVYNGVVSPYRMNPKPFRYVDVSIDEVPEFSPHSRVYLTNNKYSIAANPAGGNVRFLKKPLQRLDRMTLSVNLEGGRTLSWRGEQSHELEFEVLSLEPTTGHPEWVHQQQFGYS